MSKINLLPWRDEYKKKKKIAFFMLLGMSCAVVLGICFVGKVYVDSMINAQNERNQFLQTQSIILDRRIAEIKNIKKQKKELVRRINLIQKLEEQRNLATHLFNTMPEVTPPGVYVNSLSFKGDRIDIRGLTESNGRVSNMVRNVESSGWLGETSLPSIVTGPTKPIKLYKFSMNFVVLPEQKGAKKK